jgi:hypothetical protein
MAGGGNGLVKVSIIKQARAVPGLAGRSKSGAELRDRDLKRPR